MSDAGSSFEAGSNSRATTKPQKLFWIKDLVATNVSPKFSLTIPAEAWRQIHVPFKPNMFVWFSEGWGHGCLEGKLKFEAQENKRVTGGGWKTFVEKKELSSWRQTEISVLELFQERLADCYHQSQLNPNVDLVEFMLANHV